MTTERILWALFFSVMLGFSFSKTMEYERDANRTGFIVEKNPGRVTSVYVSPLFLPCLLAVIAVGLILIQGFSAAWKVMLSLAVEIMLALTFYYVVMLAVLPLLRRWFSARFCATMWLLPVFLYWMSHMWRKSMIEPWLVLRIPSMVYQIFGIVWLVGLVVILCWKGIAHLRFRKEVLKNSYPVAQPDILELWEREQALIERKMPIPLVYSPYVVTPMTVGKWNSTIRTLLPERSYTMTELRMIFRHELRHVQRLDVDTKIFYGFCEAFCWFNPLVWLAMRKASADLELSCDEMVVYGMEESDRRRYAELLLDTAGDDRGFSTCLSASARSLRYRLKNVMEQRKRLTGTLLLTVTMAALILCNGAVVATDTYGTLEDVLFSQYDSLTINFIMAADTRRSGYGEAFAWDEPMLIDYLRTVPITKVASRGQDFDLDDNRALWLEFDTGDDWFALWCNETWLWITRGDHAGIYRIETPLDLEKIESCLDFGAEDPDPAPVRPRMKYRLDTPEKEGIFLADEQLISVTKADESNISQLPDVDWDQIGGCEGVPVTRAILDFSYEPSVYSVEVEGRNGEEPYRIKGADIKDGVLELAPYSANYRVFGLFRNNRDTMYEMEFYFKIILPEE